MSGKGTGYPHRWTAEQVNTVYDRWHSNWPTQIIAKEIGVHHSVLKRKVRTLGLKRRDFAAVMGVAKKLGPKYRDAKIFDMSITEEERVVAECERRERVLHAAWDRLTEEEIIARIPSEKPSWIKETLAEFVRVKLVRKKLFEGRHIYLDRDFIKHKSNVNEVPGIRVFPMGNPSNRKRREY